MKFQWICKLEGGACAHVPTAWRRHWRRRFGAANSVRPSRRRYNSTPAIRHGTFWPHTYGERETVLG